MTVDTSKYLRPGDEQCRACRGDIGWMTVDRKPVAVDPKRIRWIDEAGIIREGWNLHEDTCPRLDALRKADARKAGE